MTQHSHAESGIAVYRRLLSYVLPQWRRFVVAALALVVVAGSEALFAMMMKPMLDGTFVERDPTTIAYTPIALIAIFLVRGIAAYSAEYGMARIARQVIKVLRGEMFANMLHLPVSYFDLTPSGRIISKLIYDVEQVAMAATDVVSILIRDSLSVVALLAWMFYLDWKLALVLLIGAPLIALLIRVINQRFRRYSSHIQESMGTVSHIAEEVITGQRVIKTFGGQGYESKRFEEANENNRRLNLKLLSTSAASVPLVQLIAAMAAAGVIALALSQENLSVGGFVSFITAMMMILQPMKRLTKISASLQRGIAAAISIFEFRDTPCEEESGSALLTREHCRDHPISIEIEHFSYPGKEGLVLEQIALEIKPGEIVALVGRSGSGKSTLANLIPRFYELEHGTITVGGADIRSYTRESLRAQIALVSQHITLFNGTIANNIAYGRLDGTPEEAIIAAAEAAHAWEFIRQLPQGLQTVVGENGALLSGGQRQRLSIARALLKKAPILILDEATSALDTHSERHIQQALQLLMANSTTLVIAHRLSTIEDADRIVVLEQGRVLESGNHRQLLTAAGPYSALYNLQFSEK
ncbi:MAG: lipid A export permease/ATP-binding protein MsbA [Gammaproteobacteria bacterium]|nr:lipid A export permease/ATP-binding protein MsbA [Gammaproteobacteria bacterium]